MRGNFWVSVKIPRLLTCLLLPFLLLSCGGSSKKSSDGAVAIKAIQTFSIGGTVKGLNGTLILQNNETDNISVTADGSFTFAKSLARAASYSVKILTQPTGQTCSVAAGSGVVGTTKITAVTVTCSAKSYTVSGTVSGLTGTVVLQNNADDNLSLTTDGVFTFATAVAESGSYAVTVLTQPSDQICSLSHASGTIAAANVTNVAVVCNVNTYTVGGTVSGLTGTVVLQNNAGDDLTITADGIFTFATAIADLATYTVTVLTQPTEQTCSVGTGTGTIAGGPVTNIALICSLNTYTVGGASSGLNGTLVLQNNGANNLTLTTNGDFTFTTAVAESALYSVTILTQPTGQTCSLSQASGTIAGANITNVTINCSTNTYTTGGSVSGLTGTVVLQNNGGNNLSLSTNGTFTFSTSIAYSAPYVVTVLTQPAGQTCSVSSGAGTMLAANVTNVDVVCSINTYTVGGTVSGLTGTVVLQNNAADTLTKTTNSSFTFDTPVADSASYTVTVLTQPAGQLCTVSSGTGTIHAAVTNVTVTCLNLYTVGGTISGLTSSSLVLQNNGGDNERVSTGANSFMFTTALAESSSFAVTILTQPTTGNLHCGIVSNGSGTISGANVTNVTITCMPGRYFFITASAFPGNLKGSSDTGVHGADAKCNADSNRPNTNTYKAFISDGSTRIACTTANCSGGIGENTDWVLLPSTTYYRVDGSTAIATTNSSAIFSFPLTNAYAAGSANTALRIWTGLQAFFGNPFGSDWKSSTSSYNCGGWANSGVGGHAQYLSVTNYLAISYSWQDCAETNHIACVEQ